MLRYFYFIIINLNSSCKNTSQNSKKILSGGSTPEFLSTHQSNDTRIANLKKWAPLAKAEAKKFGVTSFLIIFLFIVYIFSFFSNMRFSAF
jgi:hypothetical protein